MSLLDRRVYSQHNPLLLVKNADLPMLATASLVQRKVLQ